MLTLTMDQLRSFGALHQLSPMYVAHLYLANWIKSGLVSQILIHRILRYFSTLGDPK